MLKKKLKARIEELENEVKGLELSNNKTTGALEQAEKIAKESRAEAKELEARVEQLTAELEAANKKIKELKSNKGLTTIVKPNANVTSTAKKKATSSTTKSTTKAKSTKSDNKSNK